MSDVKKPVDLVAIRDRLDSTQGSGNAVNALLYHDVPAMAEEIEALRKAAAAMIRTIELNELECKFQITLPDLRALIPTS